MLLLMDKDKLIEILLVKIQINIKICFKKQIILNLKKPQKLFLMKIQIENQNTLFIKDNKFKMNEIKKLELNFMEKLKK